MTGLLMFVIGFGIGWFVRSNIVDEPEEEHPADEIEKNMREFLGDDVVDDVLKRDS